MRNRLKLLTAEEAIAIFSHFEGIIRIAYVEQENERHGCLAPNWLGPCGLKTANYREMALSHIHPLLPDFTM